MCSCGCLNARGCETWLAGSTLSLDIMCPVKATWRQWWQISNTCSKEFYAMFSINSIKREIMSESMFHVKVSVCIYICCIYTYTYTSWYSPHPNSMIPNDSQRKVCRNPLHMGQVYDPWRHLVREHPGVYPLPTKGFPAAAVDACSHGLLWENPLSLDDKAADADNLQTNLFEVKSWRYPPKET